MLQIQVLEIINKLRSFVWRGGLLFFLLFAFSASFAQVSVRYLGIEHGLSNNAVTCVTQDKYGFMWMGTYDGLNRYDGDQFKVFRNVWGNDKSLVNNHIRALNSSGSKVFIGTTSGLVYYNYTDSEFHNLYYKTPTGKTKKVWAMINCLATDRSGNIYAGADDLGLIIFKKNDTIGRQVSVRTKSTIGVNAIASDRNGTLWVFINGIGLCKYNHTGNTIEPVIKMAGLGNSLLDDHQNNILIGTENGLFKYSLLNKQIARVDGPNMLLTNTNIDNLMLSRNGQEIWIPTNGGGVNIWNIANKTVSPLIPGEGQNSLRSGAVTAVYEDQENRKWVTTLRGGINVIDPPNTPFRTIAHDPFLKKSVVNNFILSFCEDEQKNIWVGTDGGGLSYWHVKKNEFDHYVHSVKPGTLSSNFVVSIVKDFRNKIWIASFNGGVDAFDPSSKSFKHYSCVNSKTGFEENYLWKLFEDSKHDLWASCTWGGALYRLNRATDKFELFDSRLTNLHVLYEDSKGELWSGNYAELIKIDKTAKRHVHYKIGQDIRAINQDATKNFWIGTEGGGLILFDAQNGKIKQRYTESNGLPSNTVLNLLTNKDDLWASTYNGLFKFNIKTKAVTTYNSSDGLQSNQFSYNAAAKLSSGKMLFGGIRGFNMFSPDSIGAYVHNPVLQLTDFKVNNKSIEDTTAYTNARSLYTLKEVTIPFNEATISLSYTALEYSFPEEIKYAYYLKGWDHHWNYVGKNKSGYYTRLNEGEYFLKVRCTNTAGQWKQLPLVIKITVLPPWYRTWWAYLFYVLSIGAAIYGVLIYRQRQLTLKYEVQLANLQVEKEKEANEKKLSFFTNISHEFRTPLTLIINPIKDLLNNSMGASEELQVVYRNARRLLGLVDHLLLFRKTETENSQLRVSKTEFISLCKDVYLSFTHQVKIKKLSYEFETEADHIEVYIDREKIEIALFNLISNAIKFTPEKGHIKIAIKEDDGRVYFTIADDGVGIQKDVGDRLFDKFYQVKEKNYLKTGFGIGLYLVKTFIQNHQGSIAYHNNANGGTTFVLSFPKGKAHFKAEEIVHGQDLLQNIYHEIIDHDTHDEQPKEDTGKLQSLELLISSKQTLLVIDDNDQMRGYIKKLFNDEYTVFDACNGKDGFQLARKYMPDLIISDVVMADIDGLELCTMIKADIAINHIPIILLTGDATPEIMLKGIDSGAIDFLRKPFEKEILIARVKSILRSKKDLQNYFLKEVTLKNSTPHITEENKEFLLNCINIIENHLADERFDVETLARMMFMSYPTLFKRIKTSTGQSVNNFIRFVRLRKAAELLINTNCNVNEVALKVGINDIKYFRENFFKQFGSNPSDFIKKHRSTFQVSYTINADKVK